MRGARNVPRHESCGSAKNNDSWTDTSADKDAFPYSAGSRESQSYAAFSPTHHPWSRLHPPPNATRNSLREYEGHESSQPPSRDIQVSRAENESINPTKHSISRLQLLPTALECFRFSRFLDQISSFMASLVHPTLLSFLPATTLLKTKQFLPCESCPSRTTN